MPVQNGERVLLTSTLNDERWHQEVAVVTGASSGIGMAIARQLSTLGMKVILMARREAALHALAKELNAQGGHAFVYPINLRDTEALERILGEIQEQHGAIRLMVNNAGLGHHAPLLSGSTAHWREMLEVNVLATCVCTREAVQQMRAHGDWGQVIHISSMSAHRVPEGSGVYSATKFALRSLTESLRKELREVSSLIRIAAISPGFVETEFAAHYHRSEAKAEEIYSQYPVLQADDVARSLVYILSQPQHVQVHDLLLRPTQQPS